MSMLMSVKREARLSLHETSLRVWLCVVFFLSAISVWFGIAEINHQQATLERLRQADTADRTAQLSHQSDWGGAAYYSFHLTYDPPSDFAFAALGQRDLQPWKHRVRMLALEGQIYERDVGNPVAALVGRFDFAFLTAFVIPLVLIFLLYDLRASEKIAGRHNLLEATDGGRLPVWLIRAGLRSGAVLLALVLPLLLAGVVVGSAFQTLLWACLLVAVYVAFWTLICYRVGRWQQPATVILMALIGLWATLAVILPTGARMAIDRVVPVPAGADILMLQRETVNDAWDLPREQTLQAFFARHPEWADYQKAGDAFEWPWYYAFQEVGDLKTEPLTKAYREGRLQRDHLAGLASLLAPPSLLERSMQILARTDLRSAVAYEDRVRGFHAELRDYYYPWLFRNIPFDTTALGQLPGFESDQESTQ